MSIVCTAAEVQVSLAAAPLQPVCGGLSPAASVVASMFVWFSAISCSSLTSAPVFWTPSGTYRRWKTVIGTSKSKQRKQVLHRWSSVGKAKWSKTSDQVRDGSFGSHSNRQQWSAGMLWRYFMEPTLKSEDSIAEMDVNDPHIWLKWIFLQCQRVGRRRNKEPGHEAAAVPRSCWKNRSSLFWGRVWVWEKCRLNTD